MEHERQYFQINTKDIVIDADSQRDVNKRKDQFNRIMKHYMFEKTHPILVAAYDGKYICYDGQMTMKVLKAQNGGKDLPVDCQVTFGLTLDEIKELFVTQDDNKKHVSDADKFRVRSTEENGGEEEKAIQRLLKKNGFKLPDDPLSYDSDAICIKSVQTLKKEFKAFNNENDFDIFLYIIHEGFKGDPMQTNAKVLGGLGLFMRTYTNKYEVDSLIKALQKTRASDVIRDAEVDRTHGYRKYAVRILQAYNSNKHKQNRLENIL